MNIGQASQRSNLPAKTIRYYEEIGLVVPGRADNGYRDYKVSDVHKLAFLARARSLGFGIDECRALLALYEDEGRASADVRRIAADHLSDIEAKIEGLQEMHATLSDLVRACAGDQRPDCPILRSLSDTR
ncbi:MAG: Cu(I)-responsive transcriptional regulator [Pseudomonadota bacterium]